MMTEYKKSSAVLVFNDKGELALQFRAADDDSFPSHWDISAGGGIDEGEDEKSSAERELQEELGIQANIDVISKEHYTYKAWKPSTTRETDLWIYKAKHNGPFNPNPAEVEKVQFFTIDEIKKMVKSGQKFHPELVLVLEGRIIDRIIADEKSSNVIQ